LPDLIWKCHFSNRFRRHLSFPPSFLSAKSAALCARLFGWRRQRRDPQHAGKQRRVRCPLADSPIVLRAALSSFASLANFLAIRGRSTRELGGGW
jgi:hypothetical protein